jgi:hypothetical protein
VSGEKLPPPLPPAERTVGQLVAESIRFYGGHFWPSLALGLGPALTGAMLVALPHTLRVALVPTLGTLLWAAAFVAAAALVVGKRPTATAFAAAVVAWLPSLVQRVVVLPGFDLVTLAWFALVGLGVPASLVEGRGALDALRRGASLARADFVHALGSVATLVITIFVTGFMLVVLLHGAGDQAARVAVFLSFVVLSPLFLLGSSLLYFDQAARLRSGPRPRRRRDADVHPALDPEPPGRADPEVEP